MKEIEMLEFKDWKSGETENEYLHGTKIAYLSLGEEAYETALIMGVDLI